MGAINQMTGNIIAAIPQRENRVQLLPDPGAPLLCKHTWDAQELSWAAEDLPKENLSHAGEVAACSLFDRLTKPIIESKFLDLIQANTGGPRKAMVYLMTDGWWAYVGFSTIFKPYSNPQSRPRRHETDSCLKTLPFKILCVTRGGSQRRKINLFDLL